MHWFCRVALGASGYKPCPISVRHSSYRIHFWLFVLVNRCYHKLKMALRWSVCLRIVFYNNSHFWLFFALICWCFQNDVTPRSQNSCPHFTHIWLRKMTQLLAWILKAKQSKLLHTWSQMGKFHSENCLYFGDFSPASLISRPRDCPRVRGTKKPFLPEGNFRCFSPWFLKLFGLEVKAATAALKPTNVKCAW